MSSRFLLFVWFKVMNYEFMTKVQAETLPVILSGKDVFAQAKTGSGTDKATTQQHYDTTTL